MTGFRRGIQMNLHGSRSAIAVIHMLRDVITGGLSHLLFRHNDTRSKELENIGVQPPPHRKCGHRPLLSTSSLDDLTGHG